MTTEKFPHLKWNINAETINNVPVHLLDEDRLPESKAHFENLKAEHSANKDIVVAADNIILKIDKVLNLWNTKFSWEIMSAANDDNYAKVA